MEVEVNIKVNEDVIKTMVTVCEAIAPVKRNLRMGVAKGGKLLEWYANDSVEKLDKLYSVLEDIVDKYNEKHKE